MPYRNPDLTRMSLQAANVFQYAGQTATWHQFLTATTGNPIVGIGGSAQYRHQTISALFTSGVLRQGEMQSPGGLIAGVAFQVTTREKLSRNDTLTWRGTEYQVESDPVPSRFANFWVAQLKRAQP
jgi:hypothetical protein